MKSDSLNGKTAVFYGRLVESSRRDAERLARARGVKIASTPRESVDVVVLGEGEPASQVRARLAADFDERSRRAFELGTLEIISESNFWRRLAAIRPLETATAPSDSTASLFDFGANAAASALNDSASLSVVSSANASDFSFATFSPGATPAAVAELVGVSIQTIRRWRRRGLLVATVENGRLPCFSTREILVAKRLAFLCSTGLSEDFIEKRVAAFREIAPVDESDVASVVLKLTLASDGRDVLFDAPAGPIDRNGQRRFDFGALPTDGSFETPVAPPFLSDAEEEIALAERLAAWNASQNAAASDVATAPSAPAFLSLFQNAPAPPVFGAESAESPPESSSVSPSSEKRRFASESNAVSSAPSFDFAAPSAFAESTLPPSFALSKAARERWRAATNRRVVELCESAWRLEKEGYWEEAARVYRSALLAGGLDAGVSFRLGKVLYLLGDFSAARERFYAVLELDEDYVDARLELARTFVALDELDDALAAFRGAVEDRPDDPTIRLELGKLYLRLGKREAAEDEFRFALSRLDDPRLADDVRRFLAAFSTLRYPGEGDKRT